jgi:hypothetical protein
MRIISKISTLLAKDKIQRICYLTLCIIWLLSWRDHYRFYNAESSLGIKYIWLFSIPATLLIVQTIINKTIIWAMIFGLVSLFSVYSVYSILADTIERSGNHVKAISWNFYEVVLLITYLLVLLVVNWVIYKIKPNGFCKK